MGETGDREPGAKGDNQCLPLKPVTHQPVQKPDSAAKHEDKPKCDIGGHTSCDQRQQGDIRRPDNKGNGQI